MVEGIRLRILIAGASGFVGQHLIQAWQTQYHITVLGRNTKKLKQQFPTLDALDWHTLNDANPNNFDVVINLSGETINHLRWTETIKTKILQSRIRATEALVNWVSKNPNPNLHFISTSSLSIYGLYQQIPDESNTEQTLIAQHKEFLCQVANAWEHALEPLKQTKLNLTVMRFAVVFGKDGGAFPKLHLAAKFGFATKLGSGLQPFAWIAIDDLVKAIDWVMQKKIIGPVNMVAPQTPTQNQLSKIITCHLHRPYFLSCPAKILRLVLGQMADELLLKGIEAKPEVLLNSGFKFNHHSLHGFMNHY
jgi:uncharacterized protein (TIGR01777 family)